MQGWNAEDTCENSKQGRAWSDCLVYAVCLDLYLKPIIANIYLIYQIIKLSPIAIFRFFQYSFLTKNSFMNTIKVYVKQFRVVSFVGIKGQN